MDIALIEQFAKTKQNETYLGMNKPAFIIFCILITIIGLVIFGNIIKKISK